MCTQTVTDCGEMEFWGLVCAYHDFTQSRERVVPCFDCRQETGNLSGYCDHHYKGLPDGLVKRILTLEAVSLTDQEKNAITNLVTWNKTD